MKRPLLKIVFFSLRVFSVGIVRRGAIDARVWEV